MKAPEVNLNQLVAGVQLPALPESAIRLLELSQNPDNGPNEFAVPIEADPGLVAQVLRFVNSSYFGFSRKISSVRLAINLVGVRTVKNFVLWSAVFSLMPNPRCSGFDLRSLCADSLRRGVFARRLGRKLGLKDVEELFAAALLQDMAIPLLVRDFSQVYREFLERRDEGQRLSNLERQRFGWTHADAAALMVGRWNLPERFAELIASHVDTSALLQGRLDPSAACVACSALLPAARDQRWDDRDEFATVYRSILGSGAPELSQMFSEIDGEFVEFANLLKLPAATKPLVSCLDAGGLPFSSPVS